MGMLMLCLRWYRLKKLLGEQYLLRCFSDPALKKNEVTCVDTESDWKMALYQYLTSSELPNDPLEARRLRMWVVRFTIINGVLYKRAFTMPLLKCLGPQEVKYSLVEIHSGVCGEHLGARALEAKVLRAGFFWPTLRLDALKKVKSCDKCQRHALIQSTLISQLELVFQPTLFAQWGLDILGPFP